MNTKFLYRRSSLWLFLVIILIISTFVLFKDKDRVSAEVSLFYPETCLGGWKNTDNAEGLPSLDGLNKDEYNESNSAFISNSISEIYCGDFLGSIPENFTYDRILLKFSWSSFKTEINNENDHVDLEDSPSEDEVIDQLPQDNEDNSTEEPEIEQDLPVDQSLQEDSSESSSEPVTEEVSFINSLFTNIVYAEEISTELNPILEISYTLDGVTWNVLSNIQDVNNNFYLEMPKDAFRDISDLSKVQISIKTLSNFDTSPTIFLDSMWFEVELKRNEISFIDQPANTISSLVADIIPGTILDIIDEFTEEIVEEEQPEEPLSPPSPTPEEIANMPKLNILEGEQFVVDPMALHYCNIDPFQIDLNVEYGDLYLKLNSDSSVGYELNIGKLPKGIDVFFDLNGEKYLKSKMSKDTEHKISVIKNQDAQEGSFSIPIFFTLNSKEPSTSVCNLNIINYEISNE